MMVNFIGVKTFDDGITAYLNKFKFGNAVKVSLFLMNALVP